MSEHPAPGHGPADITRTKLRLVSYNVQGLRAGLAPVAQVLRELDPDVVCLQEAPRRLAWRGRSAALARRAHLLYVGGGGNTGGTALLTAVRVDVHDVAERRLRPTPGLTRRGVVVARMGKGAARFGVASIHLGLDAAERARHFTDISGLMRASVLSDGGEVPVVLVAGDLNESPGALTWSRMAAQYVDAGADDDTPTFSTSRPQRRIDGVFVRGPAEITSYQVLDTPLVAKASDHRPVVVELSIPADVAPAPHS
ncbi:endonuclease/exonuclease/phosphatase family protein [Phytoactinopolyspora limicola]|uniref:endonuclease/exonuclease/phosphatase family protein n=1 Tax=Phytoactinopolyspora limicola TaxID=2715536 RepID=UPI00140BF77D|nr:endonuclease/exonuclease/phosphatase family protein [Phytoactinopolyspora limicola]